MLKISIVPKRNYKELELLKRNFKLSKDPDVCIAIGGDGTFIRAAKESDVPVLAIRSGEEESVGYHSDVDISEIDYVIRCLKRGDYSADEVSNFVEVTHRGKKAYAVNEIRINNVSEEVKFSVYEIVKGRRCKVYPYVMGGDGLLVTGMIGSTAYNRSAGGPIITAPNVMCVTFINSSSPYNNPIVFDTESEIEVRVEKYSCVLRADSDYIAKLGPGDTFRVRMSDRKVRFIKLNSRRENLADKLERLYSSKMLKTGK